MQKNTHNFHSATRTIIKVNGTCVFNDCLPIHRSRSSCSSWTAFDSVWIIITQGSIVWHTASEQTVKSEARDHLRIIFSTLAVNQVKPSDTDRDMILTASQISSTVNRQEVSCEWQRLSGVTFFFVWTAESFICYFMLFVHAAPYFTIIKGQGRWVQRGMHFKNTDNVQTQTGIFKQNPFPPFFLLPRHKHQKFQQWHSRRHLIGCSELFKNS